MNQPEVIQATESDRARIRSTIILAFAADPVNRWYLADPERFLKYFPQVVDVFLAPSIANGGCFMTADGSGAALWFPPGTTADEEAADAVFGEAVPEHLGEEFGEFMAGIESYHPHDADCWYLPLIGVDPAHQGKGLGGTLMKFANQRIDEQGALGYIEASSKLNAALYRRHGFEVIGKVRTASSPTARTMLRERRT